MTRLTDTLRSLDLEGEVALAGRWVMLQGERTLIYVAEATWGDSYFAWCADPRARTVEFYRDPAEAIRAGLRRAARLSPPQCDN